MSSLIGNHSLTLDIIANELDGKDGSVRVGTPGRNPAHAFLSSRLKGSTVV